MATVTIMNPTPDTGPADQARDIVPYALSERLAGDAELAIAYLSNSKPNTGELFSQINGELGRKHKVDSRFFEKGSAAHAAPDSTVADIKRHADLAVIGTAD